MNRCLQPPCKTSIPLLSPVFPSSPQKIPQFRQRNGKTINKRRIVCNGFLPVDPWAPTMAIDSQSIASQLFAVSLFPYLGFLYFITKSKSAPKLTLFGFYFLLAFVGATNCSRPQLGINAAGFVIDFLMESRKKTLKFISTFKFHSSQLMTLEAEVPSYPDLVSWNLAKSMDFLACQSIVERIKRT